MLAAFLDRILNVLFLHDPHRRPSPPVVADLDLLDAPHGPVPEEAHPVQGHLPAARHVQLHGLARVPAEPVLKTPQVRPDWLFEVKQKAS